MKRLAKSYPEGFQGGGFRPIMVPSNGALQAFEEPIYSRTRQGGECENEWCGAAGTAVVPAAEDPRRGF